jgi:hypothetical protein
MIPTSDIYSPKYREWVYSQIAHLVKYLGTKEIFQEYLSICSPCIVSDCIKLNFVVAKGGSSIIIDGEYTNARRTYGSNSGETTSSIFRLTPRERFLVKLCDSEMIGYSACRDFYKEAYYMLRFSLLQSFRICDNFLYCLGYGINCCILLTRSEITNLKDISRLKNYSLLKEIFGSDEDIQEYYEDIRNNQNNCDTFVMMNNVPGTDLSRKILPSGSMPLRGILGTSPNGHISFLSDRQVVEYVFSLLCSCYYFQSVPSDRHLDNIMEYDTRSPLVLRIDGQEIQFSDTNTIVHIDYLAVSIVDNIGSSYLKMISRFVKNTILLKDLTALLDSNRSVLEKIYALPTLPSISRLILDGKVPLVLQSRSFPQQQKF